MKELIEPKRTGIHPARLARKMRPVKDGMTGRFLIGAYGCGACDLKNRCENYPAPKGICAPRAMLFSSYLKAGKGEILPIMIDQLAKTSMERDIEHKKGIEQGKMTDDFFRLSHLCIKLEEKIQNATYGTKSTIEHKHSWIDELRDAIKVKVIDVEPDNNSSKPRAEEEIPREVSESSGASESD